MAAFSSLPLLPSLIATLAELGLREQTDIQAQTLQPLMEGRPLVGVAETGSGKTLSYVLPMLHQLKSIEDAGSPVTSHGRPRGLVIVPGRELGEQVSKVFKSLTHGTRLRVRTTLGGTKKQIARQNVNGPLEILVATPGRLTQLMDAKQVYLDDVRTVVFDEADQMLDPGFLPVARRILSDCPRKAQLVMFSATLPAALESVIKALFPAPPVRVRTQGSNQVVATLRTENCPVINGKRFQVLGPLLDDAPDVGTMLFVNTREQSDKVADWLAERGTPFTLYRGQMDRKERRENLQSFRDADVSVLLATDLGGRGLDIERVDRVINVHMPTDVDNYLHRVGRTARAGRDGLVVNLVTERDQPLLAKLRKLDAKRR